MKKKRLAELKRRLEKAGGTAEEVALILSDPPTVAMLLAATEERKAAKAVPSAAEPARCADAPSAVSFARARSSGPLDPLVRLEKRGNL